MTSRSFALLMVATLGCPGPPPVVAAPMAAPGAVDPFAHPVRFRVSETGTATSLMDAPNEKIKARWTQFGGTIDIDPSDLTKSRGEVLLDLDDIHTETFDDPEKNGTQTSHARDWLESGESSRMRNANRWAHFTITSVECSVRRLADAPPHGDVRTVSVTAHGDMELHGMVSPMTAKLTARVSGPFSTIRVTTDEPLKVSLEEHDVKPRDKHGDVVRNAMTTLAGKVADEVQISLDITATREPAAPN